MLEKTKGIVLHQIKYTDSGIVAHLYTRKFGRQPVLVKGMRKRKTGKHGIMFQPMSVLDIEMYYKPSREMQLLKEFSLAWIPYQLNSDIRKSSVALFLGEVLSSVLKEESPHEEMFDYIERSICWFDGCDGNYANFHIAFLTGLTSYLGIQPVLSNDAGSAIFDMRNGRFVNVPPLHDDYSPPGVTEILAAFFHTPFERSGDISLSGRMRNDVLETIIKYYSLHLPTLRKINSLEVLREVFG